MPRFLDAGARLLATGLGSGHFPVAPGTAGSAVGLLLFWPLATLPVVLQVAACVVLFVAGALASTRVANGLGQKDPGLVVVDEIVGMWVTLIGLPFLPVTASLGFVLFRAMDVVKPWPARDLERWRGGWGIMADDVAAGIYAHLMLRVLLLVWPVS
ncbi:MAG: phosphatidylglycerophosphatase A [Acidobacteria bacterium]|jgi:phosphatidylglycerophosphatase A|nr:phosphatidylglycerophosphatase A [Acidobacteriota bacterium]